MIKEDVMKVLSNVLGKDATELSELTVNTKLVDLGMDSICFVQAIVAIEEKLKITISDTDLVFSKFETINDLLLALDKYFVPSNNVKKVLVCDCDNVLWHGIAGEEDIFVDQNVIDLQQEIVRLYEGGILICLCSRNEKDNIIKAFDSLEMPLKLEHIINYKINGCDKSENIQEIADELQLPLDSFVFLDDDDYEIGLVGSLIPEIICVKVDYNNMGFVEKIKNIFGNLTAQSLNRTVLYREQKEREKYRKPLQSVEDYNYSLNTKTAFRLAQKEQSERLADLSQRTHRFNLSNRHYSVREIKKLLSLEDYHVYYMSASDKFGDMGIVGAVIVREKGNNVIIESFILSCRVLMRNFEDLMIERVKQIFDGYHIYGVFVSNSQNAAYKDFYINNGVEICEQI